MAFREEISFDGGGSILNVSMAVSDCKKYNTPNKHTDVQLVLFFLNKIYREFSQFQVPDVNVPLPTKSTFTKKDIELTGLWIKDFQKTITKYEGVPIYVDGVVDRGHGAISTISKTRYTIHLMNHYTAISFSLNNRASNDEWIELALKDELMPPELRTDLSPMVIPTVEL